MDIVWLVEASVCGAPLQSSESVESGSDLGVRLLMFSRVKQMNTDSSVLLYFDSETVLLSSTYVCMLLFPYVSFFTLIDFNFSSLFSSFFFLFCY